MNEKKLSQEKDELLKNDDLSQVEKESNENLDLSELEDLEGGVNKDKQESVQGNGCGLWNGNCS